MPAITSGSSQPRPLLITLALGGALIVAATVVLWAYYGTAMFFEIVRTGWHACF
jgi:hypothetical protein